MAKTYAPTLRTGIPIKTELEQPMRISDNSKYDSNPVSSVAENQARKVASNELQQIMEFYSLGMKQLDNGLIINSKKNLKKFISGYDELNDQEDSEKADALESMEKIIAYCQNHLGCLESFNGNLHKSLECFQKSLEIFFTNLGVGAISTGAITNNIGSIFYELKDTSQAIEFHRSAQTIMKNFKNDKCVLMGDIYYNLGQDYLQNGDYSASLEFLKKATEIYQKHEGEDKVQVAETFAVIGNCLYHMNILQDAVDFLRKSLKISERLLGIDHISISEKLELLGCIYSDMKKYKYAEECFFRCLEIRKKVYQNHPLVADTQFNLAKLNLCTSESLEKSISFLKSACVIYQFFIDEVNDVNKDLQIDVNKDLLSSLDERYITSVHLLTCLYFNSHQFEESKKTLTCIEANIQTLPINLKIQIKLLLAKVSLHLGQKDKAYNTAQDALNDAKIELGEQHKNTAEAFFVTGLICRNVDKCNEAQVFLTCALNIAEILADKNGDDFVAKNNVKVYKKHLEAI